MPADIEAVLAGAKLALLPASYDELRSSCTCPDAANPCKHTAAVYYILAERFDEDPFALFTLRGRTKEELVQSLRARRAKSARGGAPASSATRAQAAVRAEAAGDAEAAATHPVLLASALDRFWCCGPELAELEVSPLASDAPDALLRQLGPLTIGEDGRDLLEVLTPAYVHLAAAAERHALRG
jgi:uncharacterized Zn finger protein